MCITIQVQEMAINISMHMISHSRGVRMLCTKCDLRNLMWIVLRKVAISTSRNKQTMNLLPGPWIVRLVLCAKHGLSRRILFCHAKLAITVLALAFKLGQ